MPTVISIALRDSSRGQMAAFRSFTTSSSYQCSPSSILKRVKPFMRPTGPSGPPDHYSVSWRPSRLIRQALPFLRNGASLVSLLLALISSCATMTTRKWAIFLPLIVRTSLLASFTPKRPRAPTKTASRGSKRSAGKHSPHSRFARLRQSRPRSRRNAGARMSGPIPSHLPGEVNFKNSHSLALDQIVSAIQDALTNWSWSREIWIVAARLLDRDYVEANVKARMTNRNWQLLMYLDSLTTACARGNTRLRIFCHHAAVAMAPAPPSRRKPVPAKPKKTRRPGKGTAGTP